MPVLGGLYTLGVERGEGRPGRTGYAASGSARFFRFFLPFLPDFFVGAPTWTGSTLTSLRFRTVYPSGSVPAASIRSGHRLHFGVLVQHFFLGFLAATGADSISGDLGLPNLPTRPRAGDP